MRTRRRGSCDQNTTEKTPDKMQTGARTTNVEDEIPVKRILRKRPLVEDKKTESEPSVTIKKKMKSATEGAPTVSTAVPKRQPESSPVGFARGLVPEKIVGITRVDGNRTFLMKWVGSNETDFVPAIEANLLCPQLVIDFYQDFARRNQGGSIQICMPTTSNVGQRRSTRIADRRKHTNQRT